MLYERQNQLLHKWQFQGGVGVCETRLPGLSPGSCTYKAYDVGQASLSSHASVSSSGNWE